MSIPLKIFSFTFTLCSLLFVFTAASAQQEFTVNFNTTYRIDVEGKADITQEISLKNNFSKIYASSYTLTLEGKKPENIKAGEAGKDLPIEVSETDTQTNILVTFPDALVGRDKSRTFELRYTMSGIATRNGQVWDVTVPKLASPELIQDYNLRLEIPSLFGTPAYVSPEPIGRSIERDYQIFSFSKDSVVRAGVVAAFGNFQVFSFDLLYHLQNTQDQEIKTEIALPPDTAFQKVYYTSIEPKPERIYLDEDGNWLAVYKLDPGERLDVKTTLAIQVFASPQEHYAKVNPREHTYYLASTAKWQVNDPQIKGLAQTLRTPRAIYEFVSNKLNYDYSRVREGTERFGAVKALQNPDQAICTEFTDLFIALVRASGIPAREINGYAYTENPAIQPLSLVADVLHAWPEYWDEKSQVWRPVDPTWADTTGGIDFFDKFDLSHVTFAIHGKETDYPAPAGTYKTGLANQKDLQGGFGSLPASLDSTLELRIDKGVLSLPFSPTVNSLTVVNSGPVAFYNIPIFLQSKNSTVQTEIKTIEFLAPFSAAVIPFEFQAPFIPSELSDIEVQAGTFSTVYTPPYLLIYLERLAVLFAILLLLVILILSPRILPKVIAWVRSLKWNLV